MFCLDLHCNGESLTSVWNVVAQTPAERGSRETAAISALILPSTPADPGKNESLLADAGRAHIRELISTTLSDFSLPMGSVRRVADGSSCCNPLETAKSHQRT